MLAKRSSIIKISQVMQIKKGNFSMTNFYLVGVRDSDIQFGQKQGKSVLKFYCTCLKPSENEGFPSNSLASLLELNIIFH